MMNSWLLKSLFAIQLCFFVVNVSAEISSLKIALPKTSDNNLQLGCSDWKPYCYKEENQIKGALVDIARAVVDNAGFEYSFDVYPWKRVYQQGLKQSNFLILGLGRTAKREKLFNWIAPLKKPSEIYAYQHVDSDISLITNDDLRHYTIAVERGSYTYDFLVERGHDQEKIIIVSRYEQLYRMVLGNRAQLLLIDSKAFRPEAIRSGLDPDLLKPSLLAFFVTEYLATGLNTSDEVVSQLKVSYETLLQQEKIKLSD